MTGITSDHGFFAQYAASMVLADIQIVCMVMTMQWTPEEQEEIQRTARETIHGFKTHAIPPGLQVEYGPDGVMKHLMENIDQIMAQSKGGRR